jgi:hypothetical protein
MQAVMLKPEALEQRVARRKYKSLLRSFRFHLLSRRFPATRSAKQAAAQSFERAMVEQAFKRYRPASTRSATGLERLAHDLPDAGFVSLGVLLEASMTALGFHVVDRASVRLRAEDIGEIYVDASPEARGALLNYLSGKTVRVLLLSGGPPEWVLHHWKTFVRHTLLDRRDPATRLHNLFHVGETDVPYLASLVKRVKINN